MGKKELGEKHLVNIKGLIDHATGMGVFKDAESVARMMEAYHYLRYAHEVLSAERDRWAKDNPSEGEQQK
jgi:hypothetical protein